MPHVKKDRPLATNVIDEAKAIAAIDIQLSATQIKSDYFSGTPMITYYYDKRTEKLRNQFDETYKDYFLGERRKNAFLGVIIEIWKWYLHIFTDEREYSAKEIYRKYVESISFSNLQPMKILSFTDMYDNLLANPRLTKGAIILSSSTWAFKGFVYEVNHFFPDDEASLLILDDFDKERRKFERLKAKFDESSSGQTMYERPRIPEKVRIEVWRRDGGKCARCGSREKLEYDHIIPISKGGSNTVRNIELLCEKHNRSKSNNIE